MEQEQGKAVHRKVLIAEHEALFFFLSPLFETGSRAAAGKGYPTFFLSPSRNERRRGESSGAIQPWRTPCTLARMSATNKFSALKPTDEAATSKGSQGAPDSPVKSPTLESLQQLPDLGTVGGAWHEVDDDEFALGPNAGFEVVQPGRGVRVDEAKMLAAAAKQALPGSGASAVLKAAGRARGDSDSESDSESESESESDQDGRENGAAATQSSPAKAPIKPSQPQLTKKQQRQKELEDLDAILDEFNSMDVLGDASDHVQNSDEQAAGDARTPAEDGTADSGAAKKSKRRKGKKKKGGAGEGGEGGSVASGSASATGPVDVRKIAAAKAKKKKGGPSLSEAERKAQLEAQARNEKAKKKKKDKSKFNEVSLSHEGDARATLPVPCSAPLDLHRPLPPHTHTLTQSPW